MEICTIGFTKHTAEGFFGTLRDEGAARLIDVRLNNVSQLAGFAKRDDLRFFLESLCGAEYLHEPQLAPTADLLKGFRGGEIEWPDYESRFLDLMIERRVEESLSRDLFEPRTVLLCSEHTAEHCHRRLVVEYLGLHWEGVSAVHLPRERGAEATSGSDLAGVQDRDGAPGSMARRRGRCGLHRHR